MTPASTQVVREPFAGKPPTISTYFSLPGRFLVLMPGVDSSGISRKIEDQAQRDRLKKIVDQLVTQIDISRQFDKRTG